MPLSLRFGIAFVFGLAGYLVARRYEQLEERRAWGLPAWGWGVIHWLSLLVGVVLFAIATRGSEHAPKTEWRLLKVVGGGACALLGTFLLLVAFTPGSPDATRTGAETAVVFLLGAGFVVSAFALFWSMRRRPARGAAAERFVL